MKTFITYWFYPLSLILTVVFAWLLKQAGLSNGLIVPILSLSIIVICFALELKYRDTQHWGHNREEITSDLLHASVSSTIPTWLFRVLFYSLIVEASSRFQSSFDIGWPNDWPLLVQIGLCLLFSEFAAYWIHRTLHTFDIGWRIHAVHHSSRNYYSLIGLRRHPLQTFITFGGRIGFLWFVGVPADILMYYTLIAATNSLCQHSSFEQKAGPLNWIMATPELHRWHHSKLVEESNRNYGDILIIYDVLFGTRIFPKDVERLYDKGMGLPDGTQVDHSYWGHLKMPFVWKAIQPEKVLSDKEENYEKHIAGN